jgi:hypothetical protein
MGAVVGEGIAAFCPTAVHNRVGSVLQQVVVYVRKHAMHSRYSHLHI